MKDKKAIKEAMLNEMSDKIDELLESENPPKDLYELEQAVAQAGNSIEKKMLETIEEYNRKSSKKKLSKM